jgi:predicted nucleic acid-binding protein
MYLAVHFARHRAGVPEVQVTVRPHHDGVMTVRHLRRARATPNPSAIIGSREWRISIWDALILRAAEASGYRCVLSEDLPDGTTYGSVVVENPIVSIRR